MISIGELATRACLLEATAPKPGNVSPQHAFDDLTYEDMVASAHALGPILEQAAHRTVGELVYGAVEAIDQAVGKNSYLGTILLFAPLARAATLSHQPFRTAVADTLRSLTAEDCQLVYNAIQLAHPGGLGTAEKYDLRDVPPSSLLLAMEQAASRDRVARQYVTDFADIFDIAVPHLHAALVSEPTINDALILLHVRLMARYPDSLIGRKLGAKAAAESARRAANLLEQYQLDRTLYEAALPAFDSWLREEGHRRNPGTTADLVAATIFVDSLTHQRLF